MVWIKNRASPGDQAHRIVDSSRGVSKAMIPEDTQVENTETTAIQAFNSDGFTLDGNVSDYNKSGLTYVSWNWKAGGAGSSNNDGSIASTVSANTTAGFSIVSYTGTGSAATIGHGLGSTPKIVIVKSRTDASTAWIFYTTVIDGSMDTLALQSTNGKSDSSTTVPASSVFYVPASSSNVNTSSKNYIAYCFAEKKGYSKFGSYTGN